MKVVVLGAGGIIGQHMVVSVPNGVEAIFTRTGPSNHLYEHLDVNDPDSDLVGWLHRHNPDIIVNLIGENRPDVVERDPAKYREVNSLCISDMVGWCGINSKTLIHLSSQAALDPVNAYGKQKREVDVNLEEFDQNWVIVRPSFVLGIRPFPGIGRENPAERILSGGESQSVDDRYFAVSFAWDVADYIWRLCVNPIVRRQIHYVANPGGLSRYDLALALGSKSERVKHDSLSGLAPRPLDTSAAYSTAHHSATFMAGIRRLQVEYNDRLTDNLAYRAKELAAFLRKPYGEVEKSLGQGFGPLHNAVTEDFNRANPRTDEELLAWYRTTDAYLWELTAYHSDPGFNYQGMVKGIAAALVSKGVTGPVACLGDGTGDLSLALTTAGIKGVAYNDLANSRIAAFAESRFFMRNARVDLFESSDFTPVVPVNCQAVISLDFLEHVTNVADWVTAIYRNLQPGGYFITQNAFGMGSGPDGAMPMHLAVNDRWITEWDPLLTSVGFVQLASNWYQKPE